MTVRLLREVTEVRREDDGSAVLSVGGIAAVSLPGVPGWLTGEPLAA